nr:TrbC family F-type conjugative pilus assembly protein [uncultured Halomonas sp.]
MRHFLPVYRAQRRVFSRLAPLAIAIAVSASATASALTDYDRALIKQTDEKVRQILDQVDIDALDTTHQNPYLDSMRLEAEDAVADNTLIQEMQAEKAAETAEVFYQDHDILVFASLSLVNDGLDDILALASSDPGIMVVFRGVPEGMKIDDGMRVMHQLAYQFDPVPNIAIDPTLFDKHNVDAVPTIIKFSPLTPRQQAPGTVLPDMGEVMKGELSVDDALASVENTSRVAGRDIIGRVEGLTRPEWMEQRIAMGEQGDFGNQGPTKGIDEPDLIEVMKQQAMGINWEHEKTAAIDRFWHRQSDKFLYFPPTKSAHGC